MLLLFWLWFDHFNAVSRLHDVASSNSSSGGACLLLETSTTTPQHTSQIITMYLNVRLAIYIRTQHAHVLWPIDTRHETRYMHRRMWQTTNHNLCVNSCYDRRPIIWWNFVSAKRTRHMPLCRCCFSLRWISRSFLCHRMLRMPQRSIKLYRATIITIISIGCALFCGWRKYS